MVNLLIPTDFSKNALNAITYALDFYKDESGIFYFLNAFWANKEPSDLAMLVPEPGHKEYEVAKKVSEEGLSKLMDTLKMRPNNPKHSYEVISSYSSLLFGIKDTITKKQINIMVTGTKGASDDEETLYGSNTISILEYITECPILAVPGNYRFVGLNNIVFPTDYETAFDDKKLKYLLEIATMHHSEINVLHINKERYLDTNQENNKALLATVFKGLTCSFHLLDNMGIQKGIQAFVKTENCDLIVFVDEKSNYVGNDLPKPLIKEIESDLIIPVLAINPRD